MQLRMDQKDQKLYLLPNDHVSKPGQFLANVTRSILDSDLT